MAGIKISELDELTGDIADSSDILVIVDVSENTTKKIQYKNLIESQIENAETADRLRVKDLSAVDSDFPVIVSQVNGTGDRFDSAGYSTGFTYNPSQDKITVSRLEGVADSALVAGAADFGLTGLNDVTDTFAGLANGQVLKYNGTQWVNLNDNTGDVGQGSVAKLITTKSAGDADAEFLIPMVGQVGSDSVDIDAELTYNPSTNTLTATNFKGNALTANYADSAGVALDARQITADSAPTTGTLYPLMRQSNLTGLDSTNFSQSLSYEVLGTGDVLSAPYFSGNGSQLTNVAADSAAVAGTIELTASNDNTATNYLHFSEEASGNGTTRTDTALNYRPDSDMLVAGNITTASGYIISDSAGELLISKAGTRLLRLDDAGNLAIAGTLSQSQTL